MARKIKVDNAVLKALTQKEKKRSVENRSKQRYVLIVCEGTKTEPNYFEAIRAKLPRGVLENVVIEGSGRNTLSIIEACIKLRDKAQRDIYRIYDEVWAVFDKDSFPDRNFNNAINKAEQLNENINCAWTNEAFELWYLLHFQYVNVAMNREDYKPYIERELTKKMNQPFSYKKNAVDMYELLQRYCIA